MYGYRITKYNPEFRDASGAYMRDEWTSISDVGKVFNGVRFEFDEYRAMEMKYLRAIRVFAEAMSVDRFAVSGFESNEADNAEVAALAGSVISLDQAVGVAQGVLREELWCRLESPCGGLRVHFGYDYYIYIETALECPLAVAATRAGGLFVDEQFFSPYGLTD